MRRKIYSTQLHIYIGGGEKKEKGRGVTMWKSRCDMVRKENELGKLPYVLFLSWFARFETLRSREAQALPVPLRSFDAPYATRTARQPPRRSSSRSHGRCALAKISRPVNSKSGELSFSLRFSARARAFSVLSSADPHRSTTVLGENHTDVGGKPDQMTLGVPFHYDDGRESTAESVAILSRCVKGSPFSSPFVFYSVTSPSLSHPASSSVDLYGATEQFSFCLSIFIIFFFAGDSCSLYRTKDKWKMLSSVSRNIITRYKII